MKKVSILNFIILAFTYTATGQTFCSDKKVITPVVLKPAGDSIISVTCNILTVGWKGSANQSYIAGVTFKNPTTGKIDTSLASSLSCNSTQNCTATIPVKANTKVNWSVQSAQVIDGRTYYSYILRGKRDLQVPNCPAPVMQAQANQQIEKEQKVAINEKKENVKEASSSKHKLIIYPNPATSEITLKWIGDYRGTATILIVDGVGQPVKVLDVIKLQEEYTHRITLGFLTAGIYYVVVQPQNGSPLRERFFKE